MDKSRLEELRSHFEAVASIIGEQLSRANPHVISLVAKWDKTDLVPGLSDMDFRIICDDQTTVDDWVQIDQAMGRIHLEMVREHPEWNRINEHTAGAGMTVAEVMNKNYYNPEYAVWHLWWGQREWLDELSSYLDSRRFGYSDEHFHLTRFLTYYSPYIHGIDPGHNLGALENKYPLHSRCWHYFAPPMLSAASLLARRNLPSKREALAWLRDNSSVAEQVHAVFEQVDAHYQTGELADPKRLKKFEDLLFTAFEQIYQPLCDSIRNVTIDLTAPREDIKKQLAPNKREPLEMLMEYLRWARTRAGRYRFYLNAPEHFSTTGLMQDELVWVRNLTKPVFDILRKVLSNQTLTPQQCLSRLSIKVSSVEQKAISHMFDMAAWSEGAELLRELYRGSIELYPHYYRVLDRVLVQVAAREGPSHGGQAK
ncbi:MAG: hypothetical protein KAT11_00440 [Phycisphaerae bacterium]|nr:hypothetical protein [Phycisphaerae bacterium]